MKKTTLFLLTTFILFFLCGCGEKLVSKSEGILSFDGEMHTDDGLTVKEKTCSYKGNDVLLVNIENTSDKNYAVSVLVTYYDLDGKKINNEHSTFDGFAPGYQKYFMFTPEITFADYKCRVISEDSENENPLIALEFEDRITFSQNKKINSELAKNEDFRKFPTLFGKIGIKNSINNQIPLESYLVVFSDSDEIFSISSCSGTVPPKTYGGTADFVLCQDTDGDFVWPEEINENTSYVLVIN